MAQRLSGEPDNTRFDSQRPEKEVTTTTHNNKTGINMSIVANNIGDLNQQNPLPVDGDSVYEKDIDVSGSDIGTFSGAVTDIFNDLDTTITSTGHSSPAYFSVKLKRPINNTSVKFCAPVGKNFSNVKITLKDRSGAVLYTVDESGDATKYTSNTYDYPLTPWCTMLVEFYTTDDIDLNWALIEKSQDVHAILRAAKPDGTLVDINATTGGNLKISIEEFDESFNDLPLPVRIANGTNGGTIHFHKDGFTATPGTYYFILIDKSDTTNYPHTNTGNIHIDWLDLEVDSDTNGNYKVTFGFLENVDATDGDAYYFKHISGTKQTGQQKEIQLNPQPNGWVLNSSYLATHQKSLNDPTFQTDVNLPSTLDPNTSDTPSGNGDFIVWIEVTAGSIDVVIDCGYHVHSA